MTVKLFRVAGFVLALCAAGPAFAATVAVAPIRDAGAKKGVGDAVRKQVEKGLADGGLRVIGASALAAGAKRQGLDPSDLARPPALMSVAGAAGADAVFQGTLVGKGKELAIRVFNLDGVELWSKTLKLAKNKLAPDIPKKIARAVTAAISSAPAANKPDTGAAPDTGIAPDTTAAPATPDTTAAPTTPDTTAAPPINIVPDVTNTQPTKPKTSSDDDDDEAPKKRKPIKTDDGDSKKAEKGEGDSTIEAPPTEAKADTQPQPPIVNVGLGFALFTRSYKVCPGVSSCSASPPAPTTGDDGVTRDVPVSYKTQAPSGGFALQGELFPLPKLVPISDSLTFTAGLKFEYMKSFAVQNAYTPDPNDPTQTGKFSSSISRLSVDLVGRLYFHMLNGTGHAGLFGGYFAPKFSVDENPILYPSSRTGFDFGAGAELPLAADFVKFSLQAAFAAANPGIDETTAYGQTGKGAGFTVRGGLTGGYSYVGYGAFADFAKFSDTFTDGGDFTTNGAVSEETYTTFLIMVYGRY